MNSEPKPGIIYQLGVAIGRMSLVGRILITLIVFVFAGIMPGNHDLLIGLTLLAILGFLWQPVWGYAGPIALALSLLLVILVYSDKSTSHSDIQQISSSIPETSQIIYCRSEEIYQDYDQNEVAADNKYKGKNINVSGIVLEIGKDFTGDPYIDLNASENPYFNIHCMLSSDQTNAAAAIRKGDRISILGIGAGFVIKSVQLRSCILK